MYRFFDVGVNFFNHQFENQIDRIIHEAKKHNVTHMIAIGSHYDNIQKNIALCENNNNIYTTYGLHPHYSSHLKKFKALNSIELLNTNNILAIGEIGLDFDRNLSTKNEQLDCFEYFLNIAKKHEDIPIYLHERSAHSETIEILKHFNLKNKKLIHCYTSGLNNLKNYLDLDCYIGITGWITNKNKNAEILDALSHIPHKKILLETDSPYLKPRNLKKRSNINEPMYISYIFDYLCEQIKISNRKDFNEIIFQNSISFFNIET